MGTSVETTIATIESEIKQFIAKHSGKSQEIDSRLLALEQLVTRGGPGPGEGFGYGEKSLGQRVIESENFALFRKGARSSGAIEVRSFKASTIVSGPWSAPPTYVPQMATPGQPQLGDGTFQPPIPISWPAACGVFCRRSGSNLVSGDFDGDGHLDLAEGLINENCADGCHIVSASILLFFGNGNGSFRASSLSTTTDFLPQFLMAADFNQDGKTDLAVAPTVEHGSSLISFYLSGQQGPLSDRASYDIGSGPISLVATDLNGDGSPDIVSADFTDAAISVALNLPPDFTMSAALPSLSVQRGGQVSEQLAIGSQTGFADSVALTCTVQGPDPMPTCSLTPGSVLPGGTAQLNISTSAAQASAIAMRLHGWPNDLGGALLLPFLSGCVFLTRLNKRRPTGAWLFPMVAATILLVSCGGNNSPPPIRNYTVSVTGTSGALQHTAKVMLTVQ